jgi:hypothetical protein
MDKASSADTNKTTAVEAKIEIIPKVWPGAFGIYKNSKVAVLVNLWPLISLLIINLAATLILNYIPVIGGIVSSLASIFISTSMLLVYLAGIRNQKMEMGEAFNKASKFFIRMIILYILIGLSALSFLLLIIPGFIIVPRILLAPYYLIDKNMDPIDAYKASWNVTKGQYGKIYGVLGATLLMSLIAVTIIGIPIAIYWLFLYGASMVILYKFLSKEPAQA